MKAFICIITFSLLCFVNIFGQKAGFLIMLGGGANYYYGLDNQDYETLKYQDNRLSIEADAFLGYRTAADENRSSNIFGFFGRAGLITKRQLKMYAADQKWDVSIDTTKSSNDFQELEFGVLAQRFLRLSVGYGWLNYYNAEHHLKSISYYCGTVGFSLPIGKVQLNILMTALGGRDYDKISFRPSSSLVFVFD